MMGSTGGIASQTVTQCQLGCENRAAYCRAGSIHQNWAPRQPDASLGFGI